MDYLPHLPPTSDHLQCLNPVSITHKQKDGERWIKRDENSYRYRCYTLFHSFSSIRSFIILYPVFLHFKCKSVTEVLNMYITLWNTELYVLLHIRYTSGTHFFFAAMCNRQYDGLFATKPRNTFWKATEKVLEGLGNNCKKCCRIQIFFCNFVACKEIHER